MTVNLEEIAEIIDSRHKTPAYADAGYPMIRVVDVKGGPLSLEGTKRVTTEVYEDFSKGRNPRTGDLVISRVGSAGIVSYVNSNDKFCLGQNTAFIIPKINSRFLYYHLTSPATQTQMAEMTVGAVQKTISLKSLKQLKIGKPSNLTQGAIADILGTLDDKIELNRQINTTLEAMAQTLFKSWFVDFDPVIDNALAAGHPIPDELAARAERRAQAAQQPSPKQPHTLPAHIRQQFPDRFVFTEEMGWVPEGWEVAPISHVSSLNPESWTLKKHPDVLTYIDLSNAKNGRINDTVAYSFTEAPSRARRVLRKDDSIIGTVRPGNRSFAFIHDDGLTGSTGFAVMRPKASHFRSFVYLALTRDEVIETLAHLADGGAYPAVRPDVVSSQPVALADKRIMTTFDAWVYPWLERIGKNESTNNTLSQLRDTLLPKLLSGQLRIPEAEQLLAEAL